MTLAEIGEKLGLNAATVCRDLEWVRHQWRKEAVENFEEARAIELRRLDLAERSYWEAWERSTQDIMTSIEARSTPNGEYRWEKQETPSGKRSFLEGVIKCIAKRWRFVKHLQRKAERAAPDAQIRKKEAAARGSGTLPQPKSLENDAALHPMHCVIGTTIDFPTPPQGQGDRGAAEIFGVALHAMHCVRTAKGITGGFSHPSPCPLPVGRLLKKSLWHTTAWGCLPINPQQVVGPSDFFSSLVGERVQRTVIPFAVLTARETTGTNGLPGQGEGRETERHDAKSPPMSSPRQMPITERSGRYTHAETGYRGRSSPPSREASHVPSCKPSPPRRGAVLPPQGNALVVLHKSRETPAGLPGR